MPTAQPDDLLVNGIKGNVAAKRRGVKHLRPEYIKWGYNLTKQIKHKNTLNLIAEEKSTKKKKKKKGPQINLCSEPTQASVILLKSEHLCRQRGRKARLSATLKHRLSESDGVFYQSARPCGYQFMWSGEC